MIMTQGFIKMSDSLEKALMEKLGDKFEEELKRVISDYAEMIDRRAALYILGIDNGLVQQGKKSIALFTELSDDNSSITFSAGVVRVFLPLEGRMHKSLRVLVVDSANNEKVLVFWDAKVDEVQAQRIEPGDMLSVENAYYKNGELHAGQYSKVAIDKKNKITPLAHVTDGKCNVAVRLLEKLSVRTYMRNDAEKRMASGWVADYSGRVRIVVWNEAVGKFDTAVAGDVLRIHNAIFKNGELHINEFANVEINPEGCAVLARPEDVVAGYIGAFSGTITSTAMQGDWLSLVARTDSKDIKIVLLEKSLDSLIGGALSPDISRAVAGYTKLKSLLGKECIFEGRMNENGVFECGRIQINGR